MLDKSDGHLPKTLPEYVMHQTLSLWIFFTTLSFAGGEAFLKLPLDAALKRAQIEKKVVFIDFYVQACKACDLMKRHTYQDDKVIAWLQAHAIALSLNAEDHAKLAEKYNVRTFPTQMFLAPDGRIAYQFSGYRGADRFLAECEVLTADEGPEAEEEEVTANANDYLADMTQVTELVASGNCDEAFKVLKKQLAVHKGDSMTDTLRANSIYLKLKRCETPEAKALLHAEYQRVHDKLRSGDIYLGYIRQFSTLTHIINGKTLLELYDEVKAGGASDVELSFFSEQLLTPMLKAQRYKEIEALEPAEHRLAEADRRMELSKKRPDEGDAIMKDYQMKIKTQVYHLLVGLNRIDQAEHLAAEILQQSQSASTYHGLAAAAFATDRFDDALAWAQKAIQVSDNGDVEILDTYAHILVALDERDKAISLVKATLATKAENSRERHRLNRLLAELSQEQGQ